MSTVAWVMGCRLKFTAPWFTIDLILHHVIDLLVVR